MSKKHIEAKEFSTNTVMVGNRQILAALGVDKVIVGVENPKEQEIVESAEGNYKRNAVEEKTIFDRTKQKFPHYFILDLETGSRGWYPGCEIHGDIKGEFDIKLSPSIESPTIFGGSDISVKILNIRKPNDVPEDGWFKVSHIGFEGFVEVSKISNIKYSDPF